MATKLPFLFVGFYILLWIMIVGISKFVPILNTNKSIVLHNLIVPTVVAVATVCIYYSRRVKHMAIISALCLLLLATVDLFMNFQKITPFAPASLLYPTTPVVT